MLLFRIVLYYYWCVCVCVCAFSLNQVLRQNNQYHFYNDSFFTFLEISLLKCERTLHMCKQHEEFDMFLSIESWSFTGSHINLCSITFSLKWMTLNNNDDDDVIIQTGHFVGIRKQSRNEFGSKAFIVQTNKIFFSFFFPHQLTRFKIQSHFVGKRVFISRKFKYLYFQFTVRLTHSRISPNSLKSEKKTDRNFLAKIYWFDLLSSDYCVYVCVCVVCVHRRLVNIYQFLDGGFFSLL